MAMLRPGGKAKKISDEVMKKKGVKASRNKGIDVKKLSGPYLQH
jgi:hypothetical protein